MAALKPVKIKIHCSVNAQQITFNQSCRRRVRLINRPVTASGRANYNKYVWNCLRAGPHFWTNAWPTLRSLSHERSNSRSMNNINGGVLQSRFVLADHCVYFGPIWHQIYKSSKEKNYYLPVLSLVSSKYFINSGNRTPKLSANPRLTAWQTADEIHTTQE